MVSISILLSSAWNFIYAAGPTASKLVDMPGGLAALPYFRSALRNLYKEPAAKAPEFIPGMKPLARLALALHPGCH